MRKVVVRLKGGLANQAYQLAAARCFADRVGANLAYSDAYFSYYRNPRGLIMPYIYDGCLERECDSIASIIAGRIACKIQDLTPFRLPYLAGGLVVNDNIYNEYHNRWVCGIPADKACCTRYILDGYFQKHLTLVESGIIDQLSILKSTKVLEGCAIHLRLGDYLIPPYNQVYWKVTSGYIADAFEILSGAGLESGLPVHIFSDSPELALSIVQQALPASYAVVVSGKSSLSDLRSLSSYKHMILSNSTFSLLAWYLSSRATAVIPRQWFLGRPTHADLFPDDPRVLLYNP